MDLAPVRLSFGPHDPRTLLAQEKHAAGRIRTHELVAEIRALEATRLAAARALIDAKLPDYDSVPLGAR